MTLRLSARVRKEFGGTKKTTKSAGTIAILVSFILVSLYNSYLISNRPHPPSPGELDAEN